MRTTRRGSALLSAVIAVLLAACTSGTASSSAGNAGATTTSGHASTQPHVPLTSSAAPAGESVLRCSDYIDGNAPIAPMQVVLGVVALPVSPTYPALQTSLSGDGNGALRLFAKTGLVIKPGSTFELIVPARLTNRLRIGWGNPGTPSQRVLVSNCSNPVGGWLGYAGGYWIDHPACVPIIVRAGGKQQQVHIGLGTACPGQKPPQGPSQS